MTSFLPLVWLCQFLCLLYTVNILSPCGCVLFTENNVLVNVVCSPGPGLSVIKKALGMQNIKPPTDP